MVLAIVIRQIEDAMISVFIKSASMLVWVRSA